MDTTKALIDKYVKQFLKMSYIDSIRSASILYFACAMAMFFVGGMVVFIFAEMGLRDVPLILVLFWYAG